MEKLEKIVWIIAGIAVVLVVAFIFVGPLKSETTKEQALADFDALARQMKAQHSKPAMPGPVAQKPAFGGATSTGASARGGVKIKPVDGKTTDVTRTDQPTAPTDGGANVASNNQWQPEQGGGEPAPNPGEAAPVYIPQSMADKYQHFEDLVELGQTAAGEDYVTPQGEQAYLLRGINEDSLLSSRLGFQPGDIIISVNGYAPSRANARQLWSTLRGTKDFQIVVERGGSRMTMPYHIR